VTCRCCQGCCCACVSGRGKSRISWKIGSNHDSVLCMLLWFREGTYHTWLGGVSKCPDQKTFRCVSAVSTNRSRHGHSDPLAESRPSLFIPSSKSINQSSHRGNCHVRPSSPRHPVDPRPDLGVDQPTVQTARSSHRCGDWMINVCQASARGGDRRTIGPGRWRPNVVDARPGESSAGTCVTVRVHLQPGCMPLCCDGYGLVYESLEVVIHGRFGA
jgi:hypothetical protein